MTYEEAKIKVLHEIHIKESKIEKLKECLNYLENDKNSNDNLTQTPEQILNNFADSFN
jgi:hypothetical protein